MYAVDQSRDNSVEGAKTADNYIVGLLLHIRSLQAAFCIIDDTRREYYIAVICIQSVLSPRMKMKEKKMNDSWDIF